MSESVKPICGGFLDDVEDDSSELESDSESIVCIHPEIQLSFLVSVWTLVEVVQPEAIVLMTVKAMYLGNCKSVFLRLVMSACVGTGSLGARRRERRKMDLWKGSG